MSLCIITVGGADPRIKRRALGDEAELAQARVIAADSGVSHARRLGLNPTIVVGDFDSARAEDLDWAVANGAELIAHARDKDATDFDLAMQLAMASEVDEIVAVGVFGGRPDHLLANMAVLASPRFSAVPVRALDIETEVWVLHGSTDHLGAGAPDGDRGQGKVLRLEVGTTVSLQAWGGDAVVTTTGFRWNLRDAALAWDASVGVSNVVEDPDPSVLVQSGVVLAVAVKSPPPPGPTFEVEI